MPSHAEVNKIVREVSESMPRALMPRQERLARRIIAKSEPGQIRRALDRQARAKFWSFSDFLTEIEINSNDMTTVDGHPAGCSYGCDAGWLPSLEDQTAILGRGEKLSLTRCPGIVVVSP